ncbi:hypothetical protein Tco_1164650 [Tanacetum coccineum]
MDPSRSWAPRWLNKEQGRNGGSVRDTLKMSSDEIGKESVLYVENGSLANIIKPNKFGSVLNYIIGNSLCTSGEGLCFDINWQFLRPGLLILIKKNNCSAGGRIEPVETPSARQKNDSKKGTCWPRFKILASFMMPIARMLARIYTILAPYGTRPRPIFETDMEAIFQEMKEKQEASDKAFEEVRLKSLESDIVDKKSLSLSGKRVVIGTII